MYKTVGKSFPKYEGIGHVTGRTTFVDDIKMPGIKMVKVLRSPFHRGIIKNLDVSAAENTTGVAGVITYKDIPHNKIGLYGDTPVLAEEEIRYKGQPIAAVVAIDEDTAMEALEKIKLDMEELKPVFDPLEAMKPDAPKVRPEGNVYVYENDVPYRRVRFGDIEKGFAEADEIIKGRYTTPMHQHAQLETQCSLARVDESDRLEIYTVSQGLYFHIGQLAPMLGLPHTKIKYVGGTVGGAFGGKNDIHADAVTAVAALKLRTPVKWRWTREEEMLYSTNRGAFILEFEDGVKKNGKIVARKIKTIHDTGGYSGFGPYAVEKNAFLVYGPFSIPNVWVDGYCVYTNKPPASSMRGFAIMNGSFAEQIHTEKVARKMGFDPWEFRFINAWREGDSNAIREKVKAVSLIETMQEAAKLAGIELPEKLKNMSSSERSE